MDLLISIGFCHLYQYFRLGIRFHFRFCKCSLSFSVFITENLHSIIYIHYRFSIHLLEEHGLEISFTALANGLL